MRRRGMSGCLRLSRRVFAFRSGRRVASGIHGLQNRIIVGGYLMGLRLVVSRCRIDGRRLRAMLGGSTVFGCGTLFGSTMICSGTMASLLLGLLVGRLRRRRRVVCGSAVVRSRGMILASWLGGFAPVPGFR